MKKIKIPAKMLRKFEQFDTDRGTMIVLSVEKNLEICAWCDLFADGKVPERVSFHFSPVEQITVYR